MTTVTDTVVPAALLAAYEDRTAAAAKHFENGGRVCGYFGRGMPVEVAMATGHMPMAIMPLPDRPTLAADEWLHDSFNPQLRLIFDQLITGELKFVDVAISVAQASPDSTVIFAARELLRQGHGGQIPPLHSYSILGHDHAPVREYGRMEIDALARRLRANSGVAATNDRLREAVAATNPIRAQWRKLEDLRRAGSLTGTDALTLIGAFRFMPADEYLEAITQTVAKLQGRQLGKPRVLVISSTSLSDTRLHQAIEAGGVIVAAEDDLWGSRAATPDIKLGDDPLQSIYDHYHDHTPNMSVYPASRRLGWFFEHSIRPEFDGVIIHMPRSDRELGWDYPRIRDYLKDKGKKLLMTRDDATTEDGENSLTNAVSKFFIKVQE